MGAFKYRLQAGFTKGFTLVELLLVILILSSLALVTTFLVDNMNEQFRFDQTKSRLEQIRRAIIGDSSRTLNGQTEVSGFVADMGRLPASLSELVELGLQNPWQMATSSLNDGSLSAVTLSIQLPGGWRGSYIDVLPSSDLSSVRAVRDGWGNADADEMEDAKNFGWAYFADLSGVVAQSNGSDGEPGFTDPENHYQKDYPADGQLLVTLHDYSLSLDGLAIEFSHAPAAPVNLKLRLYRMNDGLMTGDIESNYFSADAGNVYQVTFPNNPYEIGTYAAVVICDDVNERVFDGDCNGNSLNTRPYYFTLVPRAQLPTIQWNIH